MPRKCEGRQKIEIVKITKESSSAVAFSKRRSGVVKKASELCTLSGAQIAVIVNSQSRNKVYSFGDPNVYEVVKRFAQRQMPADSPGSQTSQFVQRLRSANVQDLYNQLTNVLDELETEKKRGKELQKMKESEEQYWWDDPNTDNMGFENLEQLKTALSQLQEAAKKQIERLMA